MGKFTIMLKLNNQWTKKGLQSKLNEFQMNESEYSTFKNLGDGINSVLRRKFIVVNIYIKKDLKVKILPSILRNTHTHTHVQIKPKANKSKEIIKIKIKINNIENKNTIEVNKSKIFSLKI